MKKMQIIGNLGKDATVHRWDDGSTTTNFSVAVTEKYTDQAGSKQEKTDWIHVSLSGDKLAQYLTKGKQVYVEGSPIADIWEGKPFMRIRAFTIELLGGGSSSVSQPAPMRADNNKPPF